MARETAQIQFDTLVIEGGLFTAEWLGRVANFAAPAQSESDYQVRAGFTLREEIALAWRAAQALWAQFDKARVTSGDNATAVTQRFVTVLLKQAFGFQLQGTSTPVTADGREFPITHFSFDGTVPVVSGTHALSLDAAEARFGDPNGQRRRSAFGLLQEYLNVQNTSLWGIVSNGLLLRVARDNASLTRPAWIEADLEQLFQEERLAEFSVLWLLLHATRFGGENIAPRECVLERWRDVCREEGIRARDVLRQGVEQALLTLGHGFLAHPANTKLREALASNRISTREFFQQLLRLVYRQIFLLTIEERGILHPGDSNDGTRELYAEGYSLRRLRDKAVRRNAHDRHHDLWEGLKLLWKGLAIGEPRLALPALGGLFAESQCRELDAARLENRHLLMALFHLAWLRDKDQPSTPLTRVNWRDMGPEELGSIYESLLELVPQIGDGSRSFTFLQGAETRGNARKTSGSYYTPDSLVQVLLDSALEPVIADKLAAHPNGQGAVDALLSTTVVDPACGSGHFLLAAARRIATHLARVIAENTGSGQPTPADYRRALRQVVGRCIYGVDLNLMAVELCKVSLWLEAVEPGLPLTFLNSHVQRGNALLGATPDLMATGIPDAAWEPIEGDDRRVASALKKRNKKAAEGQRALDALWSSSIAAEAMAVVSAVQALDAAGDADPEALGRKEARWTDILGSAEYQHQKFIADAWCTAFVWPKVAGDISDAAPTNELWRQLRDGQGTPPELTIRTVNELAEDYSLFHWHLQFPQVFAKGGFDVVLGNPPWERVKLQEQEFFASRHEDIANATNAAARKKLIAALPKTNDALWKEWCAASRRAEGESRLMRNSGRYPLCGRGDVNTYAIFAEHNRSVLGSRGRAGFIVPTGIATDDTTKAFFADLMSTRQLAAFFGFENEAKLFRGIDHRVNFCLLILSSVAIDAPRFSAFVRHAEALREPERVYSLTSEDISVLNPNTRTCPVFRTQRDAEINLSMYRRTGVFCRDAEISSNPWGVRFTSMFHMSSDSELFRVRSDFSASEFHHVTGSFNRENDRYLPLYEAKMVYHFNHRCGDFALLAPGEREHILPQVPDEKLQDPEYVTTPRYWVSETEVAQRIGGAWPARWFLGWRDVTDARSSVRTVVPCIIPFTAVSGKFPLILSSPSNLPLLYANLASFALDYAARQKIGGVSLPMFVMKQFPMLHPDVYRPQAPWDRCSGRDWILSRVLELTFTAWDLEPFARDVGCDGPPFRWDPERRFLIRCEIDAAFFHFYGLSRDNTNFVMDTFPIVRKNEEKIHGEYRTRRVILEIYDAMAEAARTGQPYQTRLDPPPADPRVAHPKHRADLAAAEQIIV